MKYMPIVPIGLFDVLDQSGVKDVFMLAQYWKNSAYREFYTSREWDTVILDNALYEENEPVPFEDMLNMANQITAKQVFVVGPECLEDGIQTGRMTREILDSMGSQGEIGPHINLMCILHEKPNEMLEQLRMVRSYTDLAFGISIFSYRLGYNRGDLAKFLKLPDQSGRYIHAFGWDNLLEVYGMDGIFQSTDSSMAATAALKNINLQVDWQKSRLPGKEGVSKSTRFETTTDNEITADPYIKKETLRNIQFLRTFCDNPYKWGR